VTDLRLYGDLAGWFHLLTHPSDYAEEAAIFHRVLEAAAGGPLGDVLELGSGGGNNASHLKAHWRLTLTDLSEEMLQISRGLNPDLEHHQGDMRSLRLGRTFDAVFLHDAAAYLLTPDDLAATARTIAAHLRPGGVALAVPDDTLETYDGGTDDGGHDDGDRGVRYLSWCFDAAPVDHQVTTHYVYLLRDGDAVTTVREDHVTTAFPTQLWLDALTSAGLEAWTEPFPHSEVEEGAILFVARKPAG